MKLFERMRKMGLLPPVPPELKPANHDLELDGVMAFVMWQKNNGQTICICWFHDDLRYNVGDYLIIKHGNETTRYRVDEIDTPRDPGDQHFLECSFAPRTREEKKANGNNGEAE